jgi:hypothetical protein
MAHPDLDHLLNVALEFAKKMLKEHGEFYPFGASMGTDGKIAMDGATTGEERPPSQELLDLLAASYAKQANTGELPSRTAATNVISSIFFSVSHGCGIYRGLRTSASTAAPGSRSAWLSL